jgi:methyl-accepting chemotaxis protein
MSLTRPFRTLQGWAHNPHLPLRTIRMRLTLLYGALFLVSGAALLAITYALAWNATKPQGGLDLSASHVAITSPRRRAELAQQIANEVHQRAADMHHLLASSGIALLIAAVLSIVLGWFVAGRALRPLRTMTAATRRITEQNLHQRLAVAGPNDELKQLGDTIDDHWPASRRLSTRTAASLPTPPTSCAPR